MGARRFPGSQFSSSGVPLVVSMRQARLALAQVGKLAAVDAAVAAADQATQISWEYATEVRRLDPVMCALARVLGMTDGDLDNLFKIARAK